MPSLEGVQEFVEPDVIESASARAAPPFTRLCATIARTCLQLGVAGLVLLLAAVIWQVFGRYVLNNTPTWAESLALLLVLYVTMLGCAVGVRDAGHIGMELLGPAAAGPTASADGDADPPADAAVRCADGVELRGDAAVGERLQDSDARHLRVAIATCR